MSFPNDFLWGASISAFQAEGAKEEDGKGLTVADLRCEEVKNRLHTADTSVASDFYHRFQEDIKLMKECGLKSFRFSISWARIFPNGNGKINQKGLDYYNKVIDKLIANNIVPIVTLFHFDLPQGLIEQYKGFCSRQCIEDFVNYARVCFENFGDRVQYWLTINEQDVIANIPFFNGLTDIKESMQANHHMNIANALVMKLYHSMNLKGQIGPCMSYPTRYPASVDPKDQFLAMHLDDMNIFALLDVLIYGEYPKYYINELKKKDILFEIQEGDLLLLKGAHPDFIAINWYTSEIVGQYVDGDSFDDYDGPALPRKNRSEKGVAQYYQNPYTKYSKYGWNIDGVGLRYALRKLYSRYHMPIMITENGFSDVEELDNGQIHDQERIEYFTEMVKNMALAIDDGVELFSYNPWSFIDVLSSSQGMDKRYGLVFIDRTNDDEKELKRVKKDSFYWYKKCIENNGKV